MSSRAMHVALAALALGAPASAMAKDSEGAPICTDRPTKANAVCTVPVGKWQLESSAASWSRTGVGGAETNVLALGSSVLKVGLSDRSDLQVGITPYVRAEIDAGSVKSHVSGFGDTTVRYKHRLTGDNSPVQVGLIPFVKLPTADDHIGNGKVEGGLAMPISISTGSPVTIVLGPELDLLADSNGDGHHTAMVNLINLAGLVAPKLNLAGELWIMTNFDPAGTVTLASTDAAFAYAIGPAVQLDLGVNFGLTKHTADTELYAGVSFRF